MLRFAVYSAVLASCAMAPTGTPASVQSDDTLAIYAAILREHHSQQPSGTFVVIDSTAPAGEFGRRAVKRIEAASPDVVAEFSAERQPKPLSLVGLPIHARIRMTSRSELRSLGSGEEYWSNFWERFPDASGYISLSEVSFSNDREEALVYVEYHCGNLCGLYYLSYLRKSNSAWSVVSREIVGAS